MKKLQHTTCFGIAFALGAMAASVASLSASAPAAKLARLSTTSSITRVLHAPVLVPPQAATRPAPRSSKSSLIPLPDGDGMALTKKACSGCHGTDTFARQRHDRDKWNQILDNMVSKGMEASDDDLDKMATYLGTYLGPSSPPPDPATPGSTPQPAPSTPPPTIH